MAFAGHSRNSSVSADHAAPAVFQVPKPSVFIISDLRLLCDGLTLGLSRQPSLKVLGGGDLSVSPAEIAKARPDVLLADLGNRKCLDLAVQCRERFPGSKIVVISVAEVDQEVFACAEAGASGFVLRDGSIDDVVTAVHCAVREELACSPRTAALLCRRIASLSRREGATAESGALTRREQEIVSLVSKGLSNKEIARELSIQNATVKNHIHSILGKLQVRRRGEVARRMDAARPYRCG